MQNKSQPDKSQQKKSQSGKSQREIGMTEVQKYIKDIDFPVGKNELLDHARQQDAPDEILELMKNSPSQQYGNPSDVSRALEQRKH
jgi:hypothetical protein